MLFLLCFGTDELPPISDANRQRHEESRLKWTARAAEAVENPSEKNLLLLARGIRSVWHPARYPSKEEKELSNELAHIMLSIPGSMGFFEERYYEAKRDWDKGLLRTQAYNDARRETLGTIFYLPSPESIRVLGSLLEDLKPVGSGESSSICTAFYALRGLMNLIDDGPAYSDTIEDQIRDRKSWMLWFEQVKAGARTFRFKGDPQPYTLAGPTEKELRPGNQETESVEARRRKTTGLENSGISEKDGVEDRRKIPWLPLGLATLLAAGGGTYLWWKSRRTAM
ncbi:hypothetical protein [Haloferula sargassicola]